MVYPFSLDALLLDVKEIGKQAADAILEIYQQDFEVKYKTDESPVTAADLKAHRIISDALADLLEGVPILSEEMPEVPFSERSQWETYWLVDPLDGTREFINRRDDFTVNIALIYKNRSILGMVYLPVENVCYGAFSGGGAWKFSGESKQALHARASLPQDGKPVISVSFSHAGKKTQSFLDTVGQHTLLRRGSMVKCCLIAEGKADLYPRLGNTCEWDTAAGQCVLEESGGQLVDLSGAPFRYNIRDSIINPPFIAYAPSVAELLPTWISSASSE